MNIVYAYFVLDIVHRGHLMMLKNSKAIAGPEGRLIVGIVSDKAVLEKKGKVPVLDFSERLELANSIQYVDLVVGQKNYTPYENVKNIAPNILMESESHDEVQINKGRELMKELGGRVIVMPYFHDQSSTLIKSKISIV
ncbi:adenylyltransferase/cytidyltransferase family protein [Planktomarina temperata]|nr:adenylyltransferase/cytidyltransferase family protein [Planktomarina temperata]MDB9834330.1 adenylyltransferase/cytidyltransferase family protein [Planktomarina temperata]